MSTISRNTQSQIDLYVSAGWKIQTCCPSGKRARTCDAVRLRSTRYAASQRFASETWAVRPKLNPVPFRSNGGQTLAPENARWTFDDFIEAVGRIEDQFRCNSQFNPVRISVAEISDYALFAREFDLDGTADQLTVRAVQLRIGGGK